MWRASPKSTSFSSGCDGEESTSTSRFSGCHQQHTVTSDKTKDKDKKIIQPSTVEVIQCNNYQYTSMNVLWCRNCSTYFKPMTSHALGGLVGSRWTLLHIQQWAVGRRHGRHLKSMTSYQNLTPVNRCVFTCRTILPNFISIRFQMMEPWLFWRA